MSERKMCLKTSNKLMSQVNVHSVKDIKLEIFELKNGVKDKKRRSSCPATVSLPLYDSFAAHDCWECQRMGEIFLTECLGKSQNPFLCRP